jgi:hypothetical protein
MIKKFRPSAGTLLFCCLILFPASLPAQDVPRVQVAVGYSRLQFDSKTLGFSDNSGLNGVTGSVAYNLAPQFGVVAESYGHWGSDLRVAGWQIGPQGLYQRWGGLFFGHALFGKAQTRATTTISTTRTGTAVTLGGGFDYPVSDRFSVRVFQVDYMRTNTFDAAQNNVRFAAGVVYRWNTVGKHRRTRTAPTTP